MMSRAQTTLFVLLLSACPGGQETTATAGETTDTEATTGTTGSSTTSSTGPSPATTEPTTSGTATESDSSDATTAPGPGCGDGVVDPDELCDDGNAINGDGCNNDCTKSGEMLWEYRSGEPYPDDFRAVEVAPDGTIIVGGSRFVLGSGWDRWLARFGADGELLWSRNYHGGVDFEGILAVALWNDTIYAAGNVDRNDGRELWVGAFSADGEPLWDDEYGSGFGDDYATGAAVTADGLVVSGVVSVGAGQAEIWVRGYTHTGEVQWTQGQPINDMAIHSLGPDIIVRKDGFLVGGYTVPAQIEPFLALYPSAGGAPIWHKNVLPMNAAIFGLAQHGDDILAAGQLLPNGTFVERLTATGEQLWSTDECTGLGAKDVAVDSQGDVVVIGFGPGAVKLNIRLCKFTSEGVFRWGKDLDSGLGDDHGFEVTILPGDRIAAVGSMWSDGENYDDAWLAVFSP